MKKAEAHLSVEVLEEEAWNAVVADRPKRQETIRLIELDGKEGHH